ncbi:MAG: histidine kinase [Phaeodactylibacter sp.]|nr:histidine kinase [Phaeodactylibacter sp.]
MLSEYLANVFHYRPGERHRLWINIAEGLPTIIIPAYLTAYWLVPRYLEQNRIVPFLLGITVMAGIVFAGRLGTLYLWIYLDGGNDIYIPPSKVLKNTIRDYSVIALAVCLKIIVDWRRQRLLNRQLRQAKAEAELQLLKAQLHPHFLFNTLNNIYGLSLQQSDKVPDSIIQLSKILDFLVYYSQKEEIALNKEVELIRNYIALEQMRYGKKLQLVAELPEVDEAIKASPLLLLPFVENAFKHSAKGKNGQWWIKMRLQMVDGRMVFSIENSKGTQSKQEKSGIGLKNIRERLALLYPKRHQLTIDDSEGVFSVRLEVGLGDRQPY